MRQRLGIEPPLAVSPARAAYFRELSQLLRELQARYDFDETEWDDAPIEAKRERRLRDLELKRKYGMWISQAELQLAEEATAAIQAAQFADPLAS